jgi:hypothetical protein
MSAATNAEADSAGRPPPAVRLAYTSDEDPIVSLRDLFAGLAMARTYAQADAMLKRR